MSILNNPLKRLRLLAWLEGISFLVLLFVAMPMKYFADMPLWVRYVGLAHGLLFVLFTVKAFQVKLEYGWPRNHFLRVWATAFIPFGMVWFDRLPQVAEEGAR